MSVESLGREGPEEKIQSVPLIHGVIQGDRDTGPAPFTDCHPASSGSPNRQTSPPSCKVNVPAAVKPVPLISRAAPGVLGMFIYDGP